MAEPAGTAFNDSPADNNIDATVYRKSWNRNLGGIGLASGPLADALARRVAPRNARNTFRLHVWVPFHLANTGAAINPAFIISHKRDLP